jgi:hypothetical protein
VFDLARKLNVGIFLVEAFVDDRNVRVIVGVMRVEYILLVEVHVIHFFKNHIGIFLFLSFPFKNRLRSGDVVVELAVDIC